MSVPESEYFEAVSSDGVRLCVRALGARDRMPILFLHGFSQSHLAWRRQFEGALAQQFRLVAFDLRGHGWSDKPDDAAAYRDPQLWADDVAAVLDAAGAERAVLVGWSYGGRVILDYAAKRGTKAIAGINFVAAVIGDAGEYYGERIGTIRGTLASNPAASIDGTRQFLRACFAREPSSDDFERMLAYNAMVPPAIRAKLLGRDVDGKAMLASLAVPVLFTQGTLDAIIAPAMSAYGSQTVPGARLSLYEGIGHSPFFEDPERFDRELADFVRKFAPMSEGRGDADRLSALGYRQELSRVLSLFDNFSVAFSYLSPMVGIYSLYTLGLGTGGPRYIWTIPVVVGGMMLVALVFGELSSEYPLSGALYQYGKYAVGPRYGWFIGWIYGFALLATVASVDSGAVGYVTALSNAWFKTRLDPSNHLVIFAIAGGIIVVSAIINSVGAKIMGHVARFGVYVETIGTFGVFLALAAAGFHQSFAFVFSSQGVEHLKTNPLGLDFGGNWWTGAALVAILANVYIFYGFESAGAISEETLDAQRQVPRAMRNALLYGGIASFVLVLGLLLATPHAGIGPVVSGGINAILGELPGWLQDFFLVMVVVAFFSCGTAVQGAGARVAFALARDGALPLSNRLKQVSPSHHTPVNAILAGTIVPFLFLLLVLINPSKPVHILWFYYPANVTALYALVSFATSGIYLAFLLTVLGALVARMRGWKPSGTFTLGGWGLPVTIGGGLYLLLMLLNIVWPSALTSGRAVFNYGWVTLLVMAIIVAAGAIYEGIARPRPGGRSQRAKA